MTTLFWQTIPLFDERFVLYATEAGLAYFGQSVPEDKWLQRYFSTATIVEDEEKLRPYTEMLTQYAAGKVPLLATLPLDFHGTDFQKQVWQALQTIPYGEVSTYSDLAAQINRPEATRAVANAIGKNPLLIVVPCHRVIGKDGTLTGFRECLALKENLLRLERENLRN